MTLKNSICSLFLIFLTGCSGIHSYSGNDSPVFSTDSLIQFVRTLSDSSFEGREAGTTGELKTLNFLEHSIKTWHPEAEIVRQAIPLWEMQSDPDLSEITVDEITLKEEVDYYPFLLPPDDSKSDSGRLFLADSGTMDSIIQSDYEFIPDFSNRFLVIPVDSTTEFFEYMLTVLTSLENTGMKGLFFLSNKTVAPDWEVDLSFFSMNQAFTSQPEAFSYSVPVYVLSPDISHSILIKFDSTPASSLPVQIRFNKKTIQANYHNLVYRIPASEKNSKTIIIGAHYDHLGRRHDGYWYPGADDNASGTAVLLELIRGIHQSGIRVKANLVFVFFGGEEKGLYGSDFFAANPVLLTDSVKSVSAMINIDMVGREHSDSIEVIGHDRLDSTFSRRITSLSGFRQLHHSYRLNAIRGEEDLMFRSDQYAFAMKGIPVVFLTDAMGENHRKQTDENDYHRVTDTPYKISAIKLQKVCYWIYHLLQDLSKPSTYLEKS